jgi:DNA replication protein DnaC
MTNWQTKWLRLEARFDGVQQLADEVEAFMGRFVRNDQDRRLLFVSGESGTGKTHCALAAFAFARAVAHHAWVEGHWIGGPPSVTFVRWSEFIESESDGVERDARDIGLTILDDVGSESDRYRSGVGVDKLCQLLDARAKKNRFTFITSNYGVEEWAERDTRVADRLLRNSVRVPLDGVTSWALRYLA